MESAVDAESALMDSYADCITQLEATPFKRELHEQHIQILKQLGLLEELETARESFNSYHPLTEEVWLDWIQDRIALLEQAPKDDITAQIELIELFKRSIQDFLSIPLLLAYSNHFIVNYYLAQGLSAPILSNEDEDEDEEMEESTASRQIGEKNEIMETIFSLETVRSVREEVLEIGGLHLSESAKLWNVWRAFEEDLLKLNPSPEQLTVVESLYLARLKVPHIGIDETFASYSSHVTKFDNANYSKSLPIANKIYSIAKKNVDIRESKEAELKKSKFVYWGYLNYARWELEPKKPDIALTRAIFERGVKEHPDNVEIWDAYLEFANGLPKSSPINLEVLGERAIKSCPGSGLLWSITFRIAEKSQLGADVVESLFQRAMDTKLLEGEIEELVKIYEGRADFHRREVEAVIVGEEELEGDMIDLVVAILLEGIKKVTAIKRGDPQLRLQKYMIRMFERFGRKEEASEQWERLTKAYSTSYAVWYARADFETRIGNFKKAHEVYLEGCSARFLDYPEYLLEAWLTFEHQNGTLADLEFTIAKVKRQRRGLEARRRREGAPIEAETSVAAVVEGEEDIEVKKRDRSESPEVVEPVAKKVKVEVPAVIEEQKRDRENSTVFVISPLEANTTEEDLTKLFADCGTVRECKTKTIGDQHLAMLEFMDKESVLAAQTKDKKRINGVEVEVHIAWQSCLYITNFPESFDKARIEEMFSQYGTIFDTRWPSKRFKNTRRFCYVQFTLASSAQAALTLHQMQLEDGLKLVVYVSDPGRKKGRTDANANDRELYIAGLSKFVKEIDLKRLFEPFGAIKGIRLTLDDKGECRGFAFVEFEEEASAIASLALNNHELKKRRMSVTVAQSRAAGLHKQAEGSKGRNVDIESRTLRVRGIPPGTEEAIVQQAFEKVAAVRMVSMTVGASEALIEFENAAEAGKALMAKDTIKIDDIDLEIFTEGAQARTIAGKKPAVAAGGGVAMLPRQASRGRGRVGLRGTRRGGIGARGGSVVAAASSTASSSTSGATVPSGTKSQDDFRALMKK